MLYTTTEPFGFPPIFFVMALRVPANIDEMYSRARARKRQPRACTVLQTIAEHNFSWSCVDMEAVIVIGVLAVGVVLLFMFVD